MKFKDWKQLTFEQRKVISNRTCQKYKLKDIIETLDFDPTSISKEVKTSLFISNILDIYMGNSSFILLYFLQYFFYFKMLNFFNFFVDKFDLYRYYSNHQFGIRRIGR